MSEFIDAIKKVEPSFTSSNDQWGYAHYASRKIFIDLESLKKQKSLTAGITGAGLPILDALWHEFGHLDVTPRTQGDFINNPDAYFFSPNSKSNEQFRTYRGGEVFTDTYFGFARFDEVWNETNNVRRMIEDVGLKMVSAARNYYQNGVDFFPKFTSALNIPLDVMYQMRADSDFEGFAKLIGNNLPGNDTPVNKGLGLFVGIHQSDPNIIRQTGALDRIPR